MFEGREDGDKFEDGNLNGGILIENCLVGCAGSDNRLFNAPLSSAGVSQLAGPWFGFIPEDIDPVVEEVPCCS